MPNVPRDLPPTILPALLECDYANLGRVAQLAKQAGSPFLHLDVMDGHFVPNLSYGPPLVRGLRPATDLILDAHLMLSHPEQFVEDFCRSGCDVVTFHVEAMADPRPALRKIRELGKLSGLALRPPTPVESIKPYLDDVDVVLPMTVMPGYSGQAFQEDVLSKFTWLRKHGPKDLILQADGGLNQDTIPRVVAAGATWLVSGSALFKASDFVTAYKSLQAVASAPIKA